MKTKEFVNLEKRLLQDFPGFAIKGSMMFISPVGHTLRGFCFETSGFDKRAFYLWSFFMPLYVPSEHIHFTFGERIGGNKRWNADQPELGAALRSEMLKELPFLYSLKTAKDVANALEPMTKRTNPHCHEAFAYTLIRSGKIGAAAEALNRLLKLIDMTVEWQQKIAERVGLIQGKLLKNPEEALKQLDIWESETASNLGFEVLRP